MRNLYKISRKYFIVIKTTDLAGGLLTPYKGSLPALESKDSSNWSASHSIIYSLSPFRLFLFVCFYWLSRKTGLYTPWESFGHIPSLPAIDFGYTLVSFSHFSLPYLHNILYTRNVGSQIYTSDLRAFQIS